MSGKMSEQRVVALGYSVVGDAFLQRYVQGWLIEQEVEYPCEIVCNGRSLSMRLPLTFGALNPANRCMIR